MDRNFSRMSDLNESINQRMFEDAVDRLTERGQERGDGRRVAETADGFGGDTAILGRSVEKHPHERGQGVGVAANAHGMRGDLPHAFVRITQRLANRETSGGMVDTGRRPDGVTAGFGRFPGLDRLGEAGTAAIRRWPSAAIAR